MSKHTKGPWAFREYAATDEMLEEAQALGIKPIRFINNDGSVPVSGPDSKICEVACQAPFKRGAGHLSECTERDANARLIAAAPELLEALKALVACCETYPAFQKETNQITFGRMEAARAAIAKAEGR
jgi:hypothetical protein